MRRSLKLILGLAIIVVFLSCLIGELPPVLIVLYLPIGWMVYLYRIAGKVHVDPLGVFNGLICLIGVLVVGHLVARWLWRELHDAGSRPWKLRWTINATLIVVLMFVAGIGAVGVTHQTAWLVRSPAPMFEYRSIERVSRIKCASNLRQLGLALQTYANNHAGRLPDTLEEVILDSHVPTEVFICPSSNSEKAPATRPAEQIEQIRHGPHNAYVYHGRGLTWPIPADQPLICEPLTNHDFAGMNILFGDGHAEFIPAKEAAKVMGELRR